MNKSWLNCNCIRLIGICQQVAGSFGLRS
jgi:hypothetical protein